MSQIKYTVKWPLSVVSNEETFDTYGPKEIANVVNFNLKSLILTSPGERRSDHDFGVGARRFLFQYNETQIDDMEELEDEIISQISQYVPYIIIDDFSIVPVEENANAIRITIQYTIPEVNKQARFDLLIST